MVKLLAHAPKEVPQNLTLFITTNVDDIYEALHRSVNRGP